MRNILLLFLLFSISSFGQGVHDLVTLHYKLDETTGTNMNEEVANQDGTLTGATINQTGKLGKCILIDDVGKYITLPDNSYTQMYTSSFTVTAWVYPTSWSTSWRVILGGESNSFVFGGYNTSGYENMAKNGTAGTNQTSLAMTSGQWNFVAVVFNSTATTNNATFYVNSTATTVTFNYDFDVNQATNLIGALSTSGNAWLGYIDEVSFFKGTQLSEVQLDSIYNSGDGWEYPFTNCPAFSGGTIGSNQSISSGADVAAFTSSAPASGGTGTITYQWKYSTTTSDPNESGWTNCGTNSTTYDHGTLTNTTYFVRGASAATCGSGYSNVLTITVSTGSPGVGSPVFRLRFEGDGVDASGNEFAGKHTGTDSTYSTGVEGTYSYNPGVSSGSWYDNWESKAAYTFADRTFTVAFNFRAVSRYLDSHVIFTNKMNSGSAGFSLRFDESTRVINGRTTNISLGHNDFTTSANAIDFNTQYHIIAIFRSGSVTMYMNGVKQTLADSVIATDWGNLTDTIAIGSYTNLVEGGWYESGYIDNFHFYDYEVNSLQSDSLYTYRNSSTFQLSGAAPPSGYYPPTGYKNFYVDGIRKIPSVKGIIKYGSKAAVITPSPEDTITYVLYDNFESWTNASVQSYDSLIKRIPMSGYYMPAQQAIVYFDGQHKNTWQSTMLNLGATSMEYYMPLGDTFSDVYFDYDLYAESDFNNIGIGGVASHKFPGGFEGGDDLNLNASSQDSIDIYGGRGGWSGLVSGHANDYLMIYPYGQPPIGSNNWYGAALGTDGTFIIPKGYWIHITYRHHMNTPGQYDGFSEVYINGVLTIRRYGLKWRSVQQGEDYGKVEQLRMEFFFGSGTGNERNSNGDNTIWMDNWVVYKYNQGANNYDRPYGDWGDLTSQIAPPINGRLMPPDLQLDETYTNASDTIYDNGKDKGYLMWPAFKNEEISKVVTRPSGTINYSFVSAQFGYDWPYSCSYVEVYAGTPGTGLTYIRSHGASSCGYTQPSGNYSIPDNEATFIIYPGSTYGYQKGIAIRYWQP